MIGQSVKLTKIREIDVGVHYSWFIVFVLITFSLTARFASDHPHWTVVEHYMVGIATSLLFFSSILLHELAHSFVALAKGKNIVLKQAHQKICTNIKTFIMVRFNYGAILASV